MDWGDLDIERDGECLADDEVGSDASSEILSSFSSFLLREFFDVSSVLFFVLFESFFGGESFFPFFFLLFSGVTGATDLDLDCVSDLDAYVSGDGIKTILLVLGFGVLDFGLFLFNEGSGEFSDGGVGDWYCDGSLSWTVHKKNQKKY